MDLKNRLVGVKVEKKVKETINTQSCNGNVKDNRILCRYSMFKKKGFKL